MRRGRLAAALPVALAIFVFGTIFGATAGPLVGAPLTLAASALIFSGAVQFAVAGLLLAGASPVGMVLTAAVLNVRNLLLGAVMRGRISASALKRAGMAWFLVDESVGLALASGTAPGAALVSFGVLFYMTWVGGTAVGLLGASLADVAGVAEAVFPVLFIGLAAISVTRPEVALRAGAAVGVTLLVASLWPAGRGVAPVIAVLAAIAPGRPR